MKKNNFVRFLFCVAVVLIAIAGLNEVSAQAASKIQNLKEKKTYKINLDKKGKKESISFKLVEGKDGNVAFKVTINGKTKTVTTEYDIYEANIQVTDIDTKDGYMDLWMYAIGGSEDVVYSALYQYQSGKLKKLYTLSYKEVDENCHLVSGVLHKASGNGKFYVRADRAFFVDALIGNHIDIIPLQLKNGKVSRVKTNTYQIYQTYNTEENPLRILSQVEAFYKKPDESSEIAMELKRFTIIKPVSIYHSGKTLYVKFETEDGRSGWYRADGCDFGEAPFDNIIWAD